MKTYIKTHWLKIATHIGALIPLAVLIWAYWQNQLTVNPIQEITFRTGKTALNLLVLTLVVTPVYTIFGYRQVIPLRKLLGLYAFLYVMLHFLTFTWLDYGLDLELLWEAIFEKRYALVGFAAFLILIPLAITSTKGWMKRLGKNWKRLHRFIYLAALLAAVHFVWLVKSDIREPLIYGAVIVLLLVFRLPPIRKAITNARNKIKQRHKVGMVVNSV